MRDDPFVAEVRRIREAHAEKFDFDLQAIYLDLKAQEERGLRKRVSFGPKRIPPVTEATKAVFPH